MKLVTRSTRRPSPYGASVALALVLFAAGSPSAAEAKVIDRSNGSFSGFVWFVYSPPELAEEQPFAAVAIGRLEEAPLEYAFGFWRDESGTHAEALPAEKVAELITAGRQVLAVKVAPMAFDQTRHLIFQWAQDDHAGQPPGLACENLLDRVARTIGLKAPYRSALQRSAPVAFLHDLFRTNR